MSAAPKLPEVIDQLIYVNYASNRDFAPHVPPARWGRLFQNVAELEARYQAEKSINRARNFCQEEE